MSVMIIEIYIIMDCLGIIYAILEDLDNSCMIITGDFNDNISKSDSFNGNHLTQFCEQFDYKLASRLLLPDDTYTYISDAWGTTSWLDHCVATDDGLNIIGDMRVLYGDSTSDHIPLAFDVNVSLAPDVEKHGPRKQGVVIWSTVSVAALLNYRMLTDIKLSNIHLPAEAIICNDVHCIDCTHINELNMLYSNIITCINAASEESLCTRSMGRNINVRPGWNEHTKELYGISREAFIAWRVWEPTTWPFVY